MYHFGGLFILVDSLDEFPEPIASPAAGCGAAVCGDGLGGVLAASAYVNGGWLVPCGSSFFYGTPPAGPVRGL